MADAMQAPEDARDPLARLLERLDLAPAGDDAFEAAPARGMRRLFGGLLAAQSAVAAMRTLDAGWLHSLHAYFLRPGRPGAALRLEVTRVRDGRSFATRRVLASQGNDAVFELTAGFTRHEGDVAHAHEPPLAAETSTSRAAAGPEALPAPESLPDWETVRAAETGEPARAPDAIEVRVVHPEHDRPGTAPPASRIVWMRPRGSLPPDPERHAALLVYASDRTLLRTAARLHGGMRHRLPASLDHAVWLHRPPGSPAWPVWDDWIVYASESPIARDGRAWVLGRMLSRTGVRLATVAQEGLLRQSRLRG